MTGKVRGGTAAACLLALAPLAHAVQLLDGEDGKLKLSWDNSIKYTAAVRAENRLPLLAAPINLNDGDNNFGRGLISNRVDWFSELDATYGMFGARVSTAAWYDSVYNRKTDNPGLFVNQVSAPATSFVEKTRNLHGRRAEVMDAFVSAKFEAGAGDMTVRLGKHSLLWGESVFFPANAIAGGQSPFDIARLVAVPNSSAKEFVLPVPQVSAQWQLSENVSVGAYYQLRYRPARLPAVGSYFSQSDTNVDGAERLLLGPVGVLRSSDILPKDSGQGGLQLKWRVGETDLGFYALKFHSKGFQQVTILGPGPTGPAPAGYYLARQQDITAYAVSASRTFGDANFAIEASVRKNQDLASAGAVDTSRLAPPGVIAATNNTTNPAYAVGSTAHINASTIWTLPQNPLFKEGSLVGEVAWNRVLSCDTQCARVAPTATRDAVALRMVIEPTYRQVLPGLDLGVPIGVGYVPKGSRSMALGAGGLPPENGGDVTIGLNGLYQAVWKFGLNYTHYYGPKGPFLNAANAYSYKQGLADRDFFSLSVSRTF